MCCRECQRSWCVMGARNWGAQSCPQKVCSSAVFFVSTPRVRVLGSAALRAQATKQSLAKRTLLLRKHGQRRRCSGAASGASAASITRLARVALCEAITASCRATKLSRGFLGGNHHQWQLTVGVDGAVASERLRGCPCATAALLRRHDANQSADVSTIAKATRQTKVGRFRKRTPDYAKSRGRSYAAAAKGWHDHARAAACRVGAACEAHAVRKPHQPPSAQG